MISVTWARFALAAIALIVWVYGYRVEDPTLRWVGIGFLAVAVLLRFLPRRRPPNA